MVCVNIYWQTHFQNNSSRSKHEINDTWLCLVYKDIILWESSSFHIFIHTCYFHFCISPILITEKAMATHSSNFAWKIPWMEEPGRPQSMGVAKSQTRLSDFTFTFLFHALEKETATHSSVLAWRIPGTGEPGGLPSTGSHRVRHDWSDLAAAAAAAAAAAC